MGDMENMHEIVAGEVAEDGQNIGHHAALSHAELAWCPALVIAVDVDEQGRGEHREEIYHHQDKELVGKWEDVQITEQEEY